MKKGIHDVHYARRTDESDFSEKNFLISNPKHMLWMLKRTVSMKIFTITVVSTKSDSDVILCLELLRKT